MTGNDYMGDVMRPEYRTSQNHRWQNEYGCLDATNHIPAGEHVKFKGDIWSGPIPKFTGRED